MIFKFRGILSSIRLLPGSSSQDTVVGVIVTTQPNIYLTQLRLRLDIIIKPKFFRSLNSVRVCFNLISSNFFVKLNKLSFHIFNKYGYAGCSSSRTDLRLSWPLNVNVGLILSLNLVRLNILYIYLKTCSNYFLFSNTNNQ